MVLPSPKCWIIEPCAGGLGAAEMRRCISARHIQLKYEYRESLSTRFIKLSGPNTHTHIHQQQMPPTHLQTTQTSMPPAYSETTHAVNMEVKDSLALVLWPGRCTVLAQSGLCRPPDSQDSQSSRSSCWLRRVTRS